MPRGWGGGTLWARGRGCRGGGGGRGRGGGPGGGGGGGVAAGRVAGGGARGGGGGVGVAGTTVCIFAPTASGGHARYTWELATALARHPRGVRVQVVSCEDLDPAFRSDDYPVHPVLPPI